MQTGIALETTSAQAFWDVHNTYASALVLHPLRVCYYADMQTSGCVVQDFIAELWHLTQCFTTYS